jgi:hypothetical protein
MGSKQHWDSKNKSLSNETWNVVSFLTRFLDYFMQHNTLITRQTSLQQRVPYLATAVTKARIVNCNNTCIVNIAEQKWQMKQTQTILPSQFA